MEWERLRQQAQLEESSQVGSGAGLIVNGPAELFKRPIAVRGGCMLETHDGIRIPIVELSLNPVVIFASEIKLLGRRGDMCPELAAQNLFSQLIDPDPPDPGGRAGEIAGDQIRVQPDRLEDL